MEERHPLPDSVKYRGRVFLLARLIDIFDNEKQCEYRGEIYSVRDNGAVMRHPKEGKKPRRLDNIWTFGKIDTSKGYPVISNVPVHRIVATAFLGAAPSNSHVVDHIDTNRQNNRPDNLRWVTRLENIVLNDITRKKLELLCGCAIEDILSDITILRDKPLTPNFDWMRAVSKEEAEKSLATWRNWANETSKREEHDRNIARYFKRDSGRNGMEYPLEPHGYDISLDAYYANLHTEEVFCYKDYPSGRYSYYILEYYLNKDTNVLSVATRSTGGIKSLFLTSITLENNGFVYETSSFFSYDGIEKYMTIARGEQWTGGEVFDDFC